MDILILEHVIRRDITYDQARVWRFGYCRARGRGEIWRGRVRMRASRNLGVAVGVLLVLALLSTFATPTAWAADTRTGDFVTVPPTETIEDNLYAAANTVN